MNARTDFAALNKRFMDAWDDLSARLGNAAETLGALRDGSEGARRDRLDRKIKGTQAAIRLWYELDPAAVDNGDYAGAWRTFEDRLAAAAKAEADPATREGLLLANGYQRGYAQDIDAQVLIIR